MHILQRREEGKDQESIQSSTTPDPGYQWESDNVTKKVTFYRHGEYGNQTSMSLDRHLNQGCGKSFDTYLPLFKGDAISWIIFVIYRILVC